MEFLTVNRKTNNRVKTLPPCGAFSLSVKCYLLLVICFLLSGCAGMVQKGGEILEGNAFTEMELALYRSEGRKENRIELRELRLEDGKWVTEISSNKWPGFVIR